MKNDKQAQQLGMNRSTASARLVKDLLFKFAVEQGNKCHRCDEELTRETFSIDHIEDWLDSEDPIRLFFDLDNVAFSHLGCNSGSGRRPHKKYFTEEAKKEAARLYHIKYRAKRKENNGGTQG